MPRQLQNQDGMALLLVLVIVALLSSLLIEFSFSTLVDLRATETFRDRTKAYYLARGGIEAARMILQEDTNEFDHPSEFWGDELANILCRVITASLPFVGKCYSWTAFSLRRWRIPWFTGITPKKLS
jgi:type II secretory pathway component PulK